MVDSEAEDRATIRSLDAGQTRIETALSTLTETVSRKFDELGLRYVPREELNSRFSGITEHQLRQDERLTSLEAGRVVDVTASDSRAERIEERLRVDRFNAKLIAIGVIGLLLTILTIVIAHWK